MIITHQFSFSGTGKQFYAELQINFTSELFLKSINTHHFMKIKLFVDNLEFI